MGRARSIRRRATNGRFRFDLGGSIAFAGMAYRREAVRSDRVQL